jgi:ABC-type nitrate/sulfonate/bicarbonate transport system substrate-binding protein
MAVWRAAQRPIFLLTAICLAFYAVSGMSPHANAQEKIKIVFPTTPTTLFLPYYVAQKKGWLEGLAIEETYVTGDSNAIRAVLSDQADFGAGVGTFAVLSAIEAGSDIKAVGSWSPLPDYNVVIASSKGKTVADLAGKVIATSGPGALPDQLPRILMRKYKVDDTTAKFIQVGGHPVRLQAVLGGRAEATLVNTVTALESIEKGDVTVVARIAKEFPNLGYVWNVARVTTLADDKKRAAIQQLTTAGIRGAKFIMDQPDEAAAILHERVPSLALDLSARVIKDLNNDKVWGVDGGLDPAIIKYTISTGVELGVLKKNVDAGAITDGKFVEAAMKSAGPGK